MRRIRGVKRKRTNSLTIKYLFVVFLFRQSIVHLLTLKKQKENEIMKNDETELKKTTTSKKRRDKTKGQRDRCQKQAKERIIKTKT